MIFNVLTSVLTNSVPCMVDVPNQARYQDRIVHGPKLVRHHHTVLNKDFSLTWFHIFPMPPCQSENVDITLLTVSSNNQVISVVAKAISFDISRSYNGRIFWSVDFGYFASKVLHHWSTDAQRWWVHISSHLCLSAKGLIDFVIFVPVRTSPLHLK